MLDNLSTGFLSALPAAAALIQGDLADPQIVRKALGGTHSPVYSERV